MSYKIYDLYYSASDVNIYLYYPVTDLSVHLDKAMGVSFTHNMSSAPVYTLGNVEPTFFSLVVFNKGISTEPSTDN